jgi:predicted aspartyl protease
LLLGVLGATFLSGWIGSPVWADAVHIPMRGIDAGTYYVAVDVARLGRMDFLVDTGSGYTAIDTGMLTAMQQTGDAVFVKQLEGMMADGSRMVVPVYRISEIRLGACLLRGVEAAVFAEGTRPILGMQALNRVAPFTFSTDPPGISLSRCDAVIAVEASAAAGAPEGQVPQRLGDAG